MPHPIPDAVPGGGLVSSIPETCLGGGGERPQLVALNLVVRAQHKTSTCELAITRSHYPTVLVMAGHSFWPAQTLLVSTYWCRILAAITGR